MIGDSPGNARLISVPMSPDKPLITANRLPVPVGLSPARRGIRRGFLAAVRQAPRGIDELDDSSEVTLGLFASIVAAILVGIVFALMSWKHSWDPISGLRWVPWASPPPSSITLGALRDSMDGAYDRLGAAFFCMDTPRSIPSLVPKRLGADAFVELSKGFNPPLSRTQAAYAFKGVDCNNDTMLDLDEFVNALKFQHFGCRGAASNLTDNLTIPVVDVDECAVLRPSRSISSSTTTSTMRPTTSILGITTNFRIGKAVASSAAKDNVTSTTTTRSSVTRTSRTSTSSSHRVSVTTTMTGALTEAASSTSTALQTSSGVATSTTITTRTSTPTTTTTASITASTTSTVTATDTRTTTTTTTTYSSTLSTTTTSRTTTQTVTTSTTFTKAATTSSKSWFDTYRDSLGQRGELASVSLEFLQIRFSKLGREQKLDVKKQVLQVLAAVLHRALPASQLIDDVSKQVFDLDGVSSSVTLGSTTRGYLRVNCRISLPLDTTVDELARMLAADDVKDAMMRYTASVPRIQDATQGTLTANDFDFIVVVRASRKVGFFAFDRDWDDKLNSDEFSRAAVALLTPPLVGAEASEALRRLDLDGDGKVSSDEFFARSAHQA